MPTMPTTTMTPSTTVSPMLITMAPILIMMPTSAVSSSSSPVPYMVSKGIIYIVDITMAEDALIFTCPQLSDPL